MSGARRVLVVYWQPRGTQLRLAVRRHLHALDDQNARIRYLNAFEPTPPWIARSAPDLCILHTTFLAARWQHDFEMYRHRFRWLTSLECTKVALPQDEYDHAAVLDEWLLELGATTVYSCFGPDQRPLLYPLLGDRIPFHDALTGYIDDPAAAAFASGIVPHSQRPVDIVYRARELPYWFGSHGQLKHRIAEVVRRRAAEHHFSTDISTREEDTIFGDRWLDFLGSGRATIGCESGSSVLDPRGEVQRRVSQLLAEEPDLTFDDVDARMPRGWDSYSFFAVGPRHLEAVITKTAQVLVEGRYSGVLEPERHYLPLRRDLANLDDVLERLRDTEAVEAMTERAYREVYLGGRHNLEAFARELLGQAAGSRTRTVDVRLGPAGGVQFPSLPASVVGPQPLRTLVSLGLTLGEALVRERETRRLLLRAVRGRSPLSVRDVVRDAIRLQVLRRLRQDADSGGQGLALRIENAAGTIVVRTQAQPSNGQRPRIDGAFERVVWDHSAVGRGVPLFPRRPERGWIALDPYGRYEFEALGSLTRTDPEITLAILERVLGT